MEHTDRPPADRRGQASQRGLAAEVRELRQTIARLEAELEELRGALVRLGGLEPAERPPAGEESPRLPGEEGLTARELEVLRLVATGLSDQEVAEQLHLSPRTVNAHLRSIYARLGVRSRSAMTRIAVERGLV